MLSSLSYAILALLASKPQSGYDIARQMKPPLGFLWQARHGQIYPELARLVKAGMVGFEERDPLAGPPRRVHTITAAGRAELAKWVVRPPHLRPVNDELVVKAFAARKARKDSTTSLLREQINQHEHRLGALEQLALAIETRGSGAPDPSSPRFGEFAVLRRSIGAEREYLSWCRWLLRQLGDGAAPADRSVSRRPARRTGAARAR